MSKKRRKINMRTNKTKARKMWGCDTNLTSSKEIGRIIYGENMESYYAIPAATASVERMVEQMARAMMDTRGCPLTTKDLSRAALAAIGITSRAPKFALPNAQADS